MSYEFFPAAEEEFLDSVSFYEARVPGLGSALIDEFESLAEAISGSPTMWKIERPPDIRRAHLRRFPLSVVYRPCAVGFQVLAVAHDSRRARYWGGAG